MTISMSDLLALMRRLRDPVTGCPWDREQTLASLVKYTLEEAYEVADVIARDTLDELPDELGDLLFQVVFYAQIAEELGQFDFHTVVEAIHAKLVRRHPHVFGTGEIKTASAQVVAWDTLKAAERATRHRTTTASELDDVPLALPASTRALKLQQRAARVGFDWPAVMPIFDKLLEEIAELKAAIAEGLSRDAQTGELGDVIFAAINLGRHLGIDPEDAVRSTNAKFERRFRHIESQLQVQGRHPAQADLNELDTLWEQAKSLGL
jgi:nucleoside triphosphate diphosphatase